MKGFGEDLPVVVNEVGAKQSDSIFRCDLLPPHFVLRISEVLKKGAKYGEWNWLGIPANEHLNHALAHIFAHIAGDKSEDHVGNAGTRIAFWIDRLIRDEEELKNLVKDMKPGVITVASKCNIEGHENCVINATNKPLNEQK